MNTSKRCSKSGWKLVLLITFVVVMGAGLCLQTSQVAWAGSKLAGKEVKIGAAFGLTGMWSDWTKKNEIAAQIAIEEINAAGGIGGVPLRLVTMVRKLAEDDKVLAILGPFSSGECEVAFPVGNKIGIPMISQASSKPGLAKKHRPYAFRNTIDEIKMGKVAVKAFINRYKVKNVVVVHDVKDAIGRILGSKVLPTVFKKMGSTVVNDGAFVTYQTSDFDMRPQVTKLKAMQFDGIAFGGVYFDAITFSKELRRQGFKQHLVGGSPFINEYFPQKGGKDVEGTFAPATFHHSIAPKGFVQKFVKNAKAKGFAPPEPIMYDINVYDAIYFLKYAMEKMGVTNNPGEVALDREKIMKGLTTIKDFKGIVGPVAFNADGDADKPIFVAEIKDGGWFINK
jgi:branched-chain amino acid transport system substrate-binding protein